MIICVLFDDGDERYMFSEAYLSFNVCYHNKEVLFKSKEVGLLAFFVFSEKGKIIMLVCRVVHC